MGALDNSVLPDGAELPLILIIQAGLDDRFLRLPKCTEQGGDDGVISEDQQFCHLWRAPCPGGRHCESRNSVESRRGPDGGDRWHGVWLGPYSSCLCCCLAGRDAQALGLVRAAREADDGVASVAPDPGLRQGWDEQCEVSGPGPCHPSICSRHRRAQDRVLQAPPGTSLPLLCRELETRGWSC